MVLELILIGLLVPIIGYALVRWGDRIWGKAKTSGSIFRKAVSIPSTIEATIDVTVLCIVSYYLLGMLFVHRINDDITFMAENTETPAEASRAVGVAVALVDREINDHFWTANDPFFLPGWMLDNMPSYQKGIISALTRFSVAMTDRVARPEGVVPVDSDLQTALGLLMYSGNVWVFDPGESWAPTVSSETQYQTALEALANYNRRLAAGDAVFRRDANSLIALVDTIARDIAAASSGVYRHVGLYGDDFLIDAIADNMFFSNKGRVYAYYLLLRELETDFDKVITKRRLSPHWARMMVTLEGAVAVNPWIVANGRPDGQLFPNHLIAQDFFLSRVATQLHQISNDLRG